MGEWVELGAIYHPKAAGSYPHQSISGLSFDLLEERLWLHDLDGYLASYTVPECLPYSSVRTCWGTTYDDAEWGITSLPRTAMRPISCARCVGPLAVRAPLCAGSHAAPCAAPPHCPARALTLLALFLPLSFSLSLSARHPCTVAWLCQ